jgi:hypothetical protein
LALPGTPFAGPVRRIDPDEISFTAVLHATRDHLIASAPCRACGHHRDAADLQTVITAAPSERKGRTRTSPRTKKQRETQHTRDVSYTITIQNQIYPKRPNRPIV